MNIETKELLTLLQAKEIQEAILNIVKEDKSVANISEVSTHQELEDKYSKLNKEFTLLTNEKNKLQDDIKEAKLKNRDMQKTIKNLETNLVDAKQEIKKYKEPFQEHLTVYEYYKNLSDTTKSSLVGIFKDDSLNGFFACGVQEKNIDNFWEYIKNELIEDKNNDIENLILIFYFLFEKYLMAYPMYVIQEVKEGEEFQTHNHIKDSNSSVSGTISKISLRGWVNTKNSKIVKKTVVMV